MKQLSAGEVLEVTGLSPKALRLWCEEGRIKPLHRARGRGNHHRFSVMQAVALAFAAEWRKWGAGMQLINPMMAAIERINESKLKREFAAGRTHLANLPGAKLWKPPSGARESLQMFDLSRAYQNVTKALDKLERQSRYTTGRRRGLSASK